DEDIAVLIHRQALALDKLGFEIFQIVVIETELPFQGPIGHPVAAPEQVHDLVEQGIKVHHPSSQPMPKGTSLSEGTSYQNLVVGSTGRAQGAMGPARTMPRFGHATSPHRVS